MKNSFPTPTKNIPNSILSELETCGSEIWNASTHLRRSAQPQEIHDNPAKDSSRAGFLLRMFAFMLLDFTYQSSPRRQKDIDRLVRNLKIGLKACKACLEAGELDLASNCIQRCGQYAAAAAEDSPLVQLTDKENDNDARASLQDQMAQLRLLRLTHAWRIERLDLAEHFYLDISNSSAKPSIALVESAAELFHGMGKSLLARKLEESAEKWLRRALAMLYSCDVTQLSQDTVEIRLAISTSLGKSSRMAKALLVLIDVVNWMTANGSAALLQQAQGIVDELKNIHGLDDRIAVQMLQLKVMLASEQIVEDKLNNVMACIVRSAVLSEQTFKM